jgi:hypothetical protein
LVAGLVLRRLEYPRVTEMPYLNSSSIESGRMLCVYFMNVLYLSFLHIYV